MDENTTGDVNAPIIPTDDETETTETPTTEETSTEETEGGEDAI